ncbi:hypothetical protein QTO01_11475 [Vibrio mytili]|uniref:hypothetical protein n=1 Tax=Vibrio mytili TaxID=50718 RepID=UPI002F3F4A3A
MNEFAFRLMKCARTYESFIVAKLVDKQTINTKELAAIEKEAISIFPELTTRKQQESVTAELELFNKVLSNLILKIGFRTLDNSSSVYTR